MMQWTSKYGGLKCVLKLKSVIKDPSKWKKTDTPIEIRIATKILIDHSLLIPYHNDDR